MTTTYDAFAVRPMVTRTELLELVRAELGRDNVSGARLQYLMTDKAKDDPDLQAETVFGGVTVYGRRTYDRLLTIFRHEAKHGTPRNPKPSRPPQAPRKPRSTK